MIVPVLGRPANAAPLVESFKASGADADLYFVCSWNDTNEINAVWDACADVVGVWMLVVDERTSGPGDYAFKIQFGYDRTYDPLVLLAADDLRFQPGWLEAVEKIADEYDVGVIGTNDNANPTVKAGRHSTHPVVRRCYIDKYGGSVGEPGQVYHQGYDHQYVDNELVATAMARGCYAHAHDAVVQHMHPLYNHTIKRDATYAKGQAKGAEDRRLFESRRHLWLNEARV